MPQAMWLDFHLKSKSSLLATSLGHPSSCQMTNGNRPFGCKKYQDLPEGRVPQTIFHVFAAIITSEL